MLGRRQIREKVVENLYSFSQNPLDIEVVEKNFLAEIEKVYHLYIYQLNFLVAQKQLGEQQIEIGKNKFLKTEENLNPNQKFINNRALIMLEENPDRLAFTTKHQELKWDVNNELVLKTFRRILAGKRYQDFMKEEGFSFEEDQKFLGKLFLKYVAENDDFHSHLEELEISWADDFHIANSMTQKTIGFLKPDEHISLAKVFKDDDDRDFAVKLLRSAVKDFEPNEKKIQERLQNWDFERISLMDKIIMLAAISELDNFPFTASRIIINEYVEIAKVYSGEKSNIFINGILDRYAKDQNRIN